MVHRSRSAFWPFAFVSAAAMVQPAFAQPEDNIGHQRHTHHHNDKHETESPTPARFITTRKSDIVLPLPQEKDAFSFVVFGDRTGGPVDGVRVLADAVRDTNLFEPDLVMTVGDLVNGYNEGDKWLEQTKEFRSIMDELRCPWFPVVGNHDVYWRGQGQRPERENEKLYEMHMGPLWYAFEHKNSWFIALHSDETNEKGDPKNFNVAANHKMSEEQFTWLKDVLAKAKNADHVFLFLHHPRWTGGQYGNEWDKVHKLLVDAGNVTAVFAGHIHRMRYDVKDGIEYVTLATVGGHQDSVVPEAGWLHHFHVVTVRKKQVAMAGVPVGQTMNVREMTAQLGDECAKQMRTRPAFAGSVALSADGASEGRVTATIKNVTSRDLDLTVTPDSDDARWTMSPDHSHARVKPGETATFEFAIARPGNSADAWYRSPNLLVDAEVLLPTHRYVIPRQTAALPIDSSAIPRTTPAQDLAFTFDGDDAILVPDAVVKFPAGPFTLETWVRGEEFGDRVGLVCKTESSDYGLFANRGGVEFSVFLGDKYTAARVKAGTLKPGRWHHVAGVYDGSEVRVYVDGALAAKAAATGDRKANKLPLILGADVNKDGGPMSFFKGQLDSVRLSRGAVYTADFKPERRLASTAETILLTNADGSLGDDFWADGPSGKPLFLTEHAGHPTLAPAR